MAQAQAKVSVILSSTKTEKNDPMVFYKSALFAAKTLLNVRQANCVLSIHLCLEQSQKQKLNVFLENWFPRSVKIEEHKPNSELDIVSKLDPLTIVFLCNETMLFIPESFILGFDAINQTTLGTYLLLVDDSTAEPTHTEIRIMGQRHWKSLSVFPFYPWGMVSRALLLSTDWALLHTKEEQALLRIINNRTICSSIPSLALCNTMPPPVSIPWQKVIDLVQSQN
jgi:hypothetical protein